MSRPFWIEYSDAGYHVLNRGRRREWIFCEECGHRSCEEPEGDRLKEIGEVFKIDRYSAVGRIVAKMEIRKESSEALRKKVDHFVSTIQMSQEQT
jgi:hypothetical protein